jgi:hypothetical protein
MRLLELVVTIGAGAAMFVAVGWDVYTGVFVDNASAKKRR